MFLGTFILLVVTPFILMWAFPHSLPDVSRESDDRAAAAAPAGGPSADLARYLAGQKRRLDSYYWIDRDRGIVHIPIEEAMKRVAEHGIDGFPKAAP